MTNGVVHNKKERLPDLQCFPVLHEKPVSVTWNYALININLWWCILYLFWHAWHWPFCRKYVRRYCKALLLLSFFHFIWRRSIAEKTDVLDSVAPKRYQNFTWNTSMVFRSPVVYENFNSVAFRVLSWSVASFVMFIGLCFLRPLMLPENC